MMIRRALLSTLTAAVAGVCFAPQEFQRAKIFDLERFAEAARVTGYKSQ